MTRGIVVGLALLVGCSVHEVSSPAPRVALATRRLADVTQTTGSGQWNLDRIDQSSVKLDGSYSYWTSAGSGVHVYIVDSGIRSTHVEFTGRIGTGRDFVHDGNGTEDCYGHGTNMAGIVGGTVYGVAKLVTLHPIRIFNCSGTGVSTDSVIAAIQWIAVNGQRPGVILVAAGGNADTTEEPAVQAAIDSGFTFVVAAGNNAHDACGDSPQRMTDVIAVAGMYHVTSPNHDYFWTAQSNYGPCVDFEAPYNGIGAYITNDSSTIQLFNGTSQASAHVAGAAALRLAEHPTDTPSQVVTYLINTATTGTIQSLPANTVNRLIRTHNGTP